MHITPWFFFASLVLFSWGIVGLLQKLSTNRVSAESALIWLEVGFLLLTPIFYPGKSVLLHYSMRSLLAILACSALNALGALALFAAMKNGGKASIVVPLTALYPLVVVISAPLVLHQSITLLQGCGVLCALTAVVLLST
jgi:bacterial/archaeal transporter family protein